jgi:hypothetical protein
MIQENASLLPAKVFVTIKNLDNFVVFLVNGLRQSACEICSFEKDILYTTK